MPNLSQQAAGTPPVAVDELAYTLDQHTASTSKNDGAQEDEAAVHAENRYQVNIEKGKGENPLRMNFEKNDDGKHTVTEVIKGGMAEQQNVSVGDLLVGFEGKSFDGMSEQQVTRAIKECKSTGKLELIRRKKDGGRDVTGAPAAAGDGKHEQRQEAAEQQTLTEADKKLVSAAMDGKLQEVKEALDDGARVDAATEDGLTPLSWATERGHKEIAGILIEKGAKMDAAGKDGGTPLYNAAWEGHKEIAAMLIARGANVNAANKDGRIPLHNAVIKGHKEIVGMLVARGARVDTANKDGVTPLYWAIGNGHKEIVEVLIEKGANVDAVDKKGKSPLDMSWDKDPSSLTTLLLISKSKRIDSMVQLHLAAKLGAQLGKQIKDCNEGKEEDRQWLGTGVKDIHGQGEDGLWVKGGDTVVGLVVRILSEGQSSLVVPLFKKLLVPSTGDVMRGISVAAVGRKKKMLTYPAADWPDTSRYLHDKRESDPQRYQRLDQGSSDALPVKGFVFALKGFLSDQRLLQAIGDYSAGMKLFETDSVRCLEQHLWKAWGKTEFLLRLVEYVGYVAAVLSFCWLVAEETESELFEVSCTGMARCFEWGGKPLPGVSEQPLWMVVLGGVVVVWSMRYLLEQVGDAILLYKAARWEQKRAMLVTHFEQQEHTTAMVEHMGGLLERHTFKALKAAVVTRESTIAFVQEKEEALLDKVFDTEITRETLVAFYEKHDPEQVKNVDGVLTNCTVEELKAKCQEEFETAPESTVVPRAEGGGSTAATGAKEGATKEAKKAATARYSHDYPRAATVAAKSQDR
jgi:hypothetical protein